MNAKTVLAALPLVAGVLGLAGLGLLLHELLARRHRSLGKAAHLAASQHAVRTPASAAEPPHRTRLDPACRSHHNPSPAMTKRPRIATCGGQPNAKLATERETTC